MAAIEELVKQIASTRLRDEIIAEVAKLKANKKFGLVFEEHLPELVRAPALPLAIGSRVVRKEGPSLPYRIISEIDAQTVKVILESNGSEEVIPKKDLIAAKAFGEPMYPALVPIDAVERSPNKPWHAVVNAENYHAIQLLLYGYSRKVDVIYIDPPYNTGARDWKYNNDYVDKNDQFRHSKWLSMMKKRLLLSQRLLKDDGVLIVTIDDYEAASLGSLIDELFRDYSRTHIAIRYNRQGTPRGGFFRTHEYAYFVSKIDLPRKEVDAYVTTRNFRRNGTNSTRQARRLMFYPFRVTKDSLSIIEVGEPAEEGFHPKSQTIEKKDYYEIWPIDDEGRERCWQWGAPKARTKISELQFRFFKGRLNPYYKTDNIPINDYETMWVDQLYDASTHGTSLVQTILNRSFPFPKSVYSVRACLDKVVWNRPDAVIVDYFAGSGTTLHATNMLNAADGGTRRCILVTNNEVSEDEATALAAAGHEPGDAEWERQGICEAVTWPRSKLTVLGKTASGEQIPGEWLTGRKLEVEKPIAVKHLSFAEGAELSVTQRKQVASLLRGVVQKDITPDPFFATDTSSTSILWDVGKSDEWLQSLDELSQIETAFVVTRDARAFRDIRDKIAAGIAPRMLQEPEVLSMSDGFDANVAYFKLEFLDPNQVSRGEKFEAIIPILWLLAGCRGPIELSAGRSKWFLPKKNPFAVLLREDCFYEFIPALKARTDVALVFLVTDSTESFRDMSEELGRQYSCIQLYKSYIDTFRINLPEGSGPISTQVAGPGNLVTGGPTHAI